VPRYSIMKRKEHFVPSAAIPQRPPPEEGVAATYTAHPEATLAQRNNVCMAQRMCAAYGAQFRRWKELQTGQKSRYTEDWQNPCWLRAVSAMREEGCDTPEVYILAQFSFGAPLAPTHLAGLDARRAYRLFIQDNDERLQRQWTSESLVFRCACAGAQQTVEATPRVIWEHVLRSPRYPLSPLFRYCLAVSEGLDETATLLRASALDQYLNNPRGYDQNWAGRIPAELRTAVEPLTQIAI
jgi:hypothetical protein